MTTKKTSSSKRTKSQLLDVLDSQVCDLSNEVCELQKFLISTSKTRRKRARKEDLEQLRVTLNQVRGCLRGSSQYIEAYKKRMFN